MRHFPSHRTRTNGPRSCLASALATASVVFSVVAGASAQTPTPTATPAPVPTLDPSICFAVPSSTNNLVAIQPDLGFEGVIGPTGASGTIRGLAIPPAIDVLYGATAAQLGAIDPATGAYTPIGAFGMAVNGVIGPLTLNDLVALAYDSSDGVLYGVHRTTLDPELCYAVESGSNRIVTIDRSSGTEAIVGVTAPGMQAVALVGSMLYGAVGDQLGIVDRSTGGFSPRPFPFGQGAPGPVDFDDVRGLSFDVVNRVMWASSRRAGIDDVLFVVSLATGAQVPGQFNAGADDYVAISGGTCSSPVDIEALAIDPAGSTLFASNGEELVAIDRTTGACNVVGPFGGIGPAVEIHGLGFDDDGALFGTNDTDFYEIDTATGEATSVAGGLVVGSNYRGVDCAIALPDALFRINPATGSFVPQHFTFGFEDYALIEGAGCGTEVDALAYDASLNTLLAIDSTFDFLMDVDKRDGFCAAEIAEALSEDDVVSLAYSAHYGALFGGGQTSLYKIDRGSGFATPVVPLVSGTNFDAIECPTPGCRLTVRKTHTGVPYAGEELTYRLMWLNPCRGIDFTNVIITDALPPGLELLSATSNSAGVTTSGNTVTLVDPFLTKAPASFATLRVRVTAPPGAQILNSVTLRDNFGREFSGTDTIRVRGSRSNASLALHGDAKVTAGRTLMYTVRYRNVGTAHALTLDLPSGVTAVTISPEPVSIAGGTITWVNLPKTSGVLRIRTVVGEAVPVSTVLTATATLVDAEGLELTSTRDAVVVRAAPVPIVPKPKPATLDLVTVRNARAGLVTTFRVRYRNVSAPAQLTVDLPPEMTVQQTVPAAVVSGSTVQWPGLMTTVGTVTVKALVSPSAISGSVMPLAATIVGSDGPPMTATAQISVR